MARRRRTGKGRSAHRDSERPEWPMLGEVLTAIVTPFGADGAVDLDALPGALPRISSTTAPTVSSSPARRARRPTLTDDERFALYEAARRRGRRPGDRGRRHRHVRHRALGPPHRARARDRRRRLPRRDAVLQQAAAAGHRRALRGGRGGDGPAGRRLQHPRRACVVNIEPATIEALAEIENVRAVKQATSPSLEQARASRDRRAVSTSTRATTISSSRSSSSAASAASACTPTSSARG